MATTGGPHQNGPPAPLSAMDVDYKSEWANEQRHAALVKELREGRLLKEKSQGMREIEAAKEAFELRGHRSVKGLGKCAAVLPGHEYFLLLNKYGQEELDSRDFWKSFQKHEPSMAANRL